ncbi:MAG: FtsP/CotA-like multicopper oxidase with cupredoxin domain [Planctomycetaceae bacterium]
MAKNKRNQKSKNNDIPNNSIVSRRTALQTGAGALAASVYAAMGSSAQAKKGGNGKGKGKGNGNGGGDGGGGTPFNYTPFTQPMPVPPVKQPLALGTPPFNVGNVFHGVAPEYFDRRTAEEINGARQPYFEDSRFPTAFYEMRMQHALAEIIPGVQTPIYGYDGLFPGPTFKARVGQPVLVRHWNDLQDVETSVHLHGGHNPSHGDGYPNFYVLPGKARDYYYTNTLPFENGVPDFNEAPSTMWYHDHGMDITDHNVWMGLAGFFLAFDDLEVDLINSNVLPGDPYDIPVVLMDRRFNSDGTLFFDPLDHNGTLGDVMVINGKAQPFFKVERRKYRFRFLNGSNARIWELRMSNGQPIIGLGKDTWLYPNAIERPSLLLGIANRADVVIDFTDAPDEVFLENILPQEDGRGPNGTLSDRKTEIPGVPIVKFIVEGPPQVNSATVDVGTPLRPHTPIHEEEVVATRIFEFERRKGAWQINHQFFDEHRADATPTLGTAERWILRNEGGGWWHPIHIHLESHQQIRQEGAIPPLEDRFKSDTALLGAGTEVELLMKFRTFKGPFVFHCHNLAHEDMRMMFVFDPRVQPTQSPQPIQQSFP